MIELKDVHKSFGNQKVLNGINLDCPKGMISVILGKSGCGKTVLLKHLIGLIKPDRGHVYVDKIDITKLSSYELKEIRKRFGFLFQEGALFDDMTVYENVSFPLKEHTRFSEDKIKKIVREKLEIVGLFDIEHKWPSELSGGMKKRVGLARAIVLNPEIILYDEPTTGLDPVMTLAIDRLILETKQKLNVTTIVISHDIESAFRIADQIAMLYEGKIIENNSAALFRKTENLAVINFLKGEK